MFLLVSLAILAVDKTGIPEFDSLVYSKGKTITFFDEQGNAVKSFSKSAIKLLQEYDWTGNIRELRNVVERLIILGGAEISEQDVQLFASK